MPPNYNTTSAVEPICVSDSFHFSSFYWRESNISLAALDQGDDSTTGEENNGRRSRSETIGSEVDSDSPVLKVRLLIFINYRV